MLHPSLNCLRLKIQIIRCGEVKSAQWKRSAYNMVPWHWSSLTCKICSSLVSFSPLTWFLSDVEAGKIYKTPSAAMQGGLCQSIHSTSSQKKHKVKTPRNRQIMKSLIFLKKKGVEHKKNCHKQSRSVYTHTPNGKCRKCAFKKKWCPGSSSFVKKNQGAGSPWDLISINWQQAVKRWPIDVMVEGVVLVNAVIIDINDLSVAPLIIYYRQNRIWK